MHDTDETHAEYGRYAPKSVKFASLFPDFTINFRSPLPRIRHVSRARVGETAPRGGRRATRSGNAGPRIATHLWFKREACARGRGWQ